MKYSYEDFMKEDMKIFPKLKPRRIKKNLSKSQNVNESICKECLGFCCKTCGCYFSPDDFEKITYKYLKKEIKKGYISIIYANKQGKAETGTFLLRVRNYGAPVVDMHDYGLIGCMLVTKEGCPFSYEQRPTGGKLLIPQEPNDEFEVPNCINRYTTKECAYEWLPYKKILYRLYRHFKWRNVKFKKELVSFKG